MVRQSRAAKRKYEGSGTGRGGPPLPNIFANTESLMRHNPTLAVLLAANLAVPAVTCEAALLCVVDVSVSTVLAVK